MSGCNVIKKCVTIKAAVDNCVVHYATQKFCNVTSVNYTLNSLMLYTNKCQRVETGKVSHFGKSRFQRSLLSLPETKFDLVIGTLHFLSLTFARFLGPLGIKVWPHTWWARILPLHYQHSAHCPQIKVIRMSLFNS